MQNSSMHKIGFAVTSPIKNEIDIDALKRVNVPFGKAKDQDFSEAIAAKFTFTVSPSPKKDGLKPFSSLVPKVSHRESSLPFSPALRTKNQDEPNRNKSFARTVFQWKTPVVMQ